LKNYQPRATAFLLFDTLARITPDVLVDLRELGDDGAVDQWGGRHNLSSSIVIEAARELRSFWADNPHAAAKLRVGGKVIVIVGSYRIESQAEKRWVAAYSGMQEMLPNPADESLRHWLVRAEEMYREREEIIFNGGRRPRSHPPVRNEMPRHCEWFVKVHIQNKRPVDLAGRNVADRAAIERATNKVAKLLGLRRKTWPRGRRR